MFCVVIVVKKCGMASPGSLPLFCTAYQQDTFGAYDQSYTFAQPAVQTEDVVNCVVKRVY